MYLTKPLKKNDLGIMIIPNIKIFKKIIDNINLFNILI